jgi:hypothetical protein
VRRATALVLVALACAADADAHAPTTSIGRAVDALGGVSVSYEPGAAVSDVQAGGFPHLVDSNPKVAFMSASASTELAGGPDAIAGEIATEARLSGTLVVLVGTRLGTWSNEIREPRLAELVDEARASSAGGSPVATVESLVRLVQEESTDGRSWKWIAAGIAVIAIASLALLVRLSRRNPAPASLDP